MGVWLTDEGVASFFWFACWFGNLIAKSKSWRDLSLSCKLHDADARDRGRDELNEPNIKHTHR